MSWEGVVKTSCRQGMQPTLAFFERVDNKPRTQRFSPIALSDACIASIQREFGIEAHIVVNESDLSMPTWQSSTAVSGIMPFEPASYKTGSVETKESAFRILKQRLLDLTPEKNAYLFECESCNVLTFLHHSRCTSCGSNNQYFDSKIRISPQIEQAFTQELRAYN